MSGVKENIQRVRYSATNTTAERCIDDEWKVSESLHAGFVWTGKLTWLSSSGTFIFDTAEACLLNYKGSKTSAKVSEILVHHVMSYISQKYLTSFNFRGCLRCKLYPRPLAFGSPPLLICKDQWARDGVEEQHAELEGKLWL